MICQVCGTRTAMVHLEEFDGAERRHLWLCEICAQARNDDRFVPQDEDEGQSVGSGETFGSFLDQGFDPGFDPEAPVHEGPEFCPACGFELVQLGTTNRLGCPTCYETFRDRLRPLLVRIHHHSSHLGRIPRRTLGEPSLDGEIARHRVALEKAIVAERYEDAARMRDLISRLESERRGTSGRDETPGTPEGS